MEDRQDIWQEVLNTLSKNKVRFSPIRGIQDKIDEQPLSDGNIYFATDSKMIWLDAYVTDKLTQQKTLTRLLMGNGTGGSSGNTGFIYANADFSAGSLEQEDPDRPIYYIYKQAFPATLESLPLVDTLIINSNGWFFRVIERGSGEHSNRVTAELISSGGGGGSGESSKAENIHLKMTSFPTNLINGRDAEVKFIPYAAKDRNGIELDEEVIISWTLEYTETGNSYIQYATDILPPIPSGKEYSFNFGPRAKHSSRSRLTLVISELNSTNTQTWTGEFITSDLTLTLPTNFSNNSIFGTDSMTISCYQSGNMDKLLEFYWDDALIESRQLNNNSNTEQTINVTNFVDEITHGYHTVKIILSQYTGNQKGFSLDPLEFEVATRDPQSTIPIIWLGNYKSSYYNYDNIQIPFRVFVANGNAEVHLYKDGKELDGSPRTIVDDSKFSIFEIVNFDLNMLNNYTLSCEQDPENPVSRNIEFTVTQDPLREDFGIQKKGYLTLDFDASGRSNSESELKRASWSYDNNGITKQATFTNFNWYNNGWITENNKTCLRISNGASFSIPIGNMVFAGADDGEQSHSFEFQFKIRNVQDYSNLIHNITRYKNDTDYFNAFYDTAERTYKTEYTNYDAFLANYFKTNNIPYTEPGTEIQRNMEYDDLEFDRVDKQINLNAVACGFFSGDNQSVTGICLGPQDAFFSNGTNTVNVDYVEDNIINLSAVYSNTTKLMYIYINGVLTGVIKNSLDCQFEIASTNNTEKTLIFNSNFCDIDLYKIRFYRTDLNVNDIVTNFAVDLKDVLIYDQNQLAIENSAIKEYQFNYSNMITDYNIKHFDSPIMPYIIFDTTNTNNGDKLSYAKSVRPRIGVEFVNTPLELAYTSGELETLSGPSGDKLWKDGDTSEQKAAAVKKYYQHHCPSWKGENIQMAVQGTSSEFYPRRNYKLKTKTKDTDGVERIHIFLNRGPFAEEYNKNENNTRQNYWYMDNYTAGTTKFTMKIDFMESSGSYNMGFANLVKNAYSKHPLDDLNNKGALTTDETSYTEATNYDSNTTYWYKNHKGNWKNSKDDELLITSEEDYNLGPIALAAQLNTSNVLQDTTSSEYNKWYTAVISYVPYTISNTEDYRTSVQGFRTLAFHKKSDGTYTYIGMYNMLLDKGSDEMYGFKPDKTTEENVYQKFLKNKKVSKIAECWEFENNSRTFCSFRDPLNRKDLSFNVYSIDSNTGEKTPVLNSKRSAPVVADSFEYRYHTDGDILDYIMDPDKNGDKLEAEDTVAYMDKKNVRLDFDKNNIESNYEAREKVIFDDYKNWEKAVAWVWSTNTDSVLSGGSYIPVKGLVESSNNLWETGKYYIYDVDNQEYKIDNSNSWDEDEQYYLPGEDEFYNLIRLGTTVYTKNTYYIDVNEAKVLSTDDFDPALTYYTFNALSDADMASGTYGKYDRLVEQCKETDAYDNTTPYYTYDGEKPAGEAVKIAVVTQEQYEADPTQYYKGITKSWPNIPRTYTYDTKEYRIDKFINELEKHFDIEYMSTYFVMTEVFECYDSRGKNCMMASWGPQEQGGDYIWYPIFYDIDTQLGINNTGIPSFEYNVDATEDGNFSTSDSILWNNFYKYFKSSRILMKYKHLKGVTAGVSWPDLKNPPLRSVDNIEAWYRTDPEVCKSIVMRGKRPLIATNLDEYYKYITITNNISVSNGTTGYITSDGSWGVDGGTYYYALQGDRSLSRQQFLKNRLEYIDSWLNQGNYTRGGNNRMWGRVAANNPTNTSDAWVEDPADLENTSYWLDPEETQKRHEFDAEYWLTLKPTHSTYVTLGDDNEAYPSQKYNGINPIKFEVSSIKQGVRQSANYPEQLLYVYGMNEMSDVGDMSNLYWQEFKIEGNAKHLTKLLLGYDGLDENNNRWHNDKLNPPTIPASKNSSGMPLLKEVNFSNIQISKEPKVLDLTSCEKLENFRATGSNLTEVKFAEGVALNTLYLPTSITRLELIEARLLTKLLTTYTIPTKNNVTNKLEAVPGLYIEGLFTNNASTNLTALKILGGNLGYDSYKLLKQYFDTRTANNASSIATIEMTNVEWSPYELVQEDEEYDGNPAHYRFDDHHYGLSEFTYSEGDWKIQVANKEIYKRNTATEVDVQQISNIEMLKTFITNNNYKGEKSSIPNITGIIYINNETAIDEDYIRNTLQVAYPGLTFLFTNVNKKPSARFIYFEEDNITYKYVTENPLSIQTLSSANAADNKWFDNPLIKYGNLDKLRNNYDFFGWGKRVNNEASGDNIYTIGDYKYEVLISNDGGSWIRPEGNLDLDYIFYAIFILHQYKRTYINADGAPILDINGQPLINYQTYAPGYGVNAPKDKNNKEIIPTLELPNNSENLLKVNKFKGWALTKQPTVPYTTDGSSNKDFSQLSIGQDYDFIAVYEKISVYDSESILDSKYLEIQDDLENNGIAIGLNPNYYLTGKITLPTVINNKTVTRIGTLSPQRDFNGQYHKITHIFWADPPSEGHISSRGLKTIGAGAFFNSSVLEYYEQPTTCTKIEQNAFSGCINLSKNNNILIKNILEPVNYLGQTIFNNCINIETLYLPGHGYNHISTNAFGGLGSTKNLELGSAADPCLWEEMFSQIDEETGQPVLTRDQRVFGNLGFRTSGYANIYAARTENLNSILDISSTLTVTWVDS